MAGELSGWTRARPIRIAFLVEDKSNSASVLDGIFADCYGRWGGRFSLIVPCVAGKIGSAYLPWLKRYGPDIVYSYVDLCREDILDLYERISPHEYIYHKYHPNGREDVYGIKPQFEPKPLSSLSLIFRLARFAPAPSSGAPIKLIDSWYTETPSRALSDNFGVYRFSAEHGVLPSDARGVASLISVVSPQFKEDRQYGVPVDLPSLSSELEVYQEFANHRIRALSVISAQFAPRLEFYLPRWSDSFNVILGEEFNDRLLFWNARLLTPAWLDGDIGVIRVTIELLRDPSFRDAIGLVLRNRNHFGGNGHRNITIRSTSASESELAEAAELLRATKPWGNVVTETVQTLDQIIPEHKAMERAAERAHTDQPFARTSDWVEFEWTAPAARPPTKVPEHILDGPPRHAFARDYWCADFTLQYAGVEAGFGKNTWVLPSRWRLASAFRPTSSGESGPTGWTPAGWTSRDGHYSVFASEGRPVIGIEVPTAFSAIQYGLALDHEVFGVGSECYPVNKIAQMQPSNEARYLTGILGMVGGLQRAQQLLLHPFLADVFASFGGTTNLPADKSVPTANRLRKLSLRKPSFDLRDEDERSVLATLILKASLGLSKPLDYLSYDALHARWAAYRLEYWRANPQPVAPDDAEGWEEIERNALDAALTELRERQMFFQGHQWTCSHCHHRNWLDMSELASNLQCKVCRKEEPAPLNLKWLFRPNNFVVESLRDHSVMSLLWTLSALQARARQSFIFVGPTWFYFDRTSEKVDAEADLIALVDGKIVLCEVKASWAILRRSDVVDLVKLAKRLRPDKAVLAILGTGLKLKPEIDAAARNLLEAGIAFELITLDNHPLDHNPYLR